MQNEKTKNPMKHEIISLLKQHGVIEENETGKGDPGKRKFTGQIIIHMNDGGITSIFANKKVG
jgi:hypothetical protein